MLDGSAGQNTLGNTTGGLSVHRRKTDRPTNIDTYRYRGQAGEEEEGGGAAAQRSAGMDTNYSQRTGAAALARGSSRSRRRRASSP